MSTIKPHLSCKEGRHVFIPIRWAEDVKTQERWVTELTCQHCLHFVSTDAWRQHLGQLEMEQAQLNMNTPKSNHVPVEQLYSQAQQDYMEQQRRRNADIIDNTRNMPSPPINSMDSLNRPSQKKRGRPFANKKV